MVDTTLQTASLRDLLAHRQWLQRLARTLVLDESRADDLEQEVWLKALKRPPSKLASPRAWLRTLARRTAIDGHRADTRRASREQKRANVQRGAAASDLVAQAELQRWVTGAVLALEERLRSTVLLRYVGEYTIAEVAELQALPIETVRSRLRRAREILRERLDDRHGGERATWCALMGPLSDGIGSAAATGTGLGLSAAGAMGGALVMSTKHVLLMALLLVLVGLGVWSFSRDPGLEASKADDPSALALEETREDVAHDGQEPALVGHIQDAGGRTALLPGETPPPEPVAPPQPTRSSRSKVTKGAAVARGVVAGNVTDLRGNVLEGVSVLLWNATGQGILARMSTGKDGAFRFDDLEEGGYKLSLHGPGWVSLSHALKAGESHLEIALDMLETITGTIVLAGSGEPVAGAHVAAVAVDVGAGTTAPSNRRSHVRTDDEGRFVIRGLRKEPYTLAVGFVVGERVSGNGHLPVRTAPVEAGTSDVRVEVEPGLAISGTVHAPDGTPWGRGAEVRCSALSDADTVDYGAQRIAAVKQDGTFHLGGLPKGSFDLTIVPVAGDHGASTAHLRRMPAGATDLRVHLVEGKPLTLRLVDEHGEAVAGDGWVWVFPQGAKPGVPGSVRAKRGEGGVFRTSPLDVGRALDVSAQGFVGYADGQLRGVLPGAEDLVLTLPRGGRIVGQVVTEAGHPVSGKVLVQARVIDLEGDEWQEAWASVRTQSDAQGRFTLGGLEDRTYWVWAGGAGSRYIAAAERPSVLPGGDPVDIVVTSGAPRKGRIVMKSEKGIRGLVIAVRGVGALSHATSWTSCSDDGSFAFVAVPPGAIEIGGKFGGRYRWFGPFPAGSDAIEIVVER